MTSFLRVFALTLRVSINTMQDYLGKISRRDLRFPLLALMAVYLLCSADPGLSLRPLAVEFPVIEARHEAPTIGSIDAVFGRSDGTVTVIDFKMRVLQPQKYQMKECLQLLAYGCLLQSQVNISVTQLLLVQTIATEETSVSTSSAPEF